jgi:FkbM family methyltransferase
MITAKEILKEVIIRTCGADFQHRIRRLHTVRQIIHNRHPREPEMALMKSLVSSGDFVADIGANVGVYTIEVSRAVGPEGRVYSFEPLRENYDILSALVRKAELGNVLLVHAALGSVVAKGEMIIPEAAGFLGYYQAHLAQLGGSSGKRERVDIISLDELHRRGVIQRVDFIKCDVEGGELEVLQGGQTVIGSHKPGWLMEVSKQKSGQVFATLKDLGYRAYVFNGALKETQGYRDKEFSNYFFFHPGSMFWKRVAPHLGS